MGRRGNMRARPGLLFVIVFAVCLVIVYLSWRSMMSPGLKVKDTYSVQVQSFLDDTNRLRNTGGNLEEPEGENHDRDPDYDIEGAQQKKQLNAPSLQYEFAKKSNNFSNEVTRKPQSADVKSSEKQSYNTDEKEIYHNPNGLIVDTVKSMERYVHLDLKGAPPKLSYLKDFISFVKKLGATGLLIEYEDMFPYSEKLRYISAKNAYSRNDINEILETARANNLKVMPLIQTFGHMEFVLKSDFTNLRESKYTPQVIDITQNETYEVISEMIKQILTAHPDSTHLHIGCDEVYELGKGASDVHMRSRNLTKSQMFLHHVHRVSSIVRRHGGRGVVPVMWDDELRKTSLSDIVNSKLPSLVEIMVWHYTKHVLDAITGEVWDKYAKVFKSVWIASAFKGATGARQFYTEPLYHLENHYRWLDTIAANNGHLTFKGVALTGWQRYDHFATLCELLPVAIPSLAVCLATMKNAGFTEKIHMDTSKLLNCGRPIELSFPEIEKETGRAVVTQDCRFTGHELYYAMQELYGNTVGTPSIKHRLDGWLSDYQVAHNFTSPGQIMVLSRALAKQNSAYNTVSVPLRRSLASFYFDDTVDEWMEENIKEPQRRIDEQQKKIVSLQLYKSWPQRPLPVVRDAKKISKFNGTSNENKYFQQSQRNDANNQLPQPAQQRFQHDNTGSENEYNQNVPHRNPLLPLHSQYQQNDDTVKVNPPKQETSLDSKLLSGNNRVIEKQDNPRGVGLKLPQLPEWSNSKDVKGEQTFGSKKSGTAFEDFKGKNNIAGFQNSQVDKNKDNLSKQNVQIDDNKRENKQGFNQDRFKADDSKRENKRDDLNRFAFKDDENRKRNVIVEPDRYSRPDGKVIQNVDLPEVKDFRVKSQLVEDDRMRREKYLSGEERIDIPSDLKQPKLKNKNSAEVGKSDGVLRSRESLKTQGDDQDTSADLRKNTGNLKLNLGREFENNGLYKLRDSHI